MYFKYLQIILFTEGRTLLSFWPVVSWEKDYTHQMWSSLGLTQRNTLIQDPKLNFIDQFMKNKFIYKGMDYYSI